MSSKNTTPQGFTAFPSELQLKIVGNLQDLCTQEYKQRKEASVNTLLAPTAQYTELLAFCRLSKACASVRQEVLVRHCDLTGPDTTSRTMLLAHTLLNKPGLRSRVHSVKVDLISTGRVGEVAGLQQQYPTILPAILQLLERLERPPSSSIQ
jgi:hypothetical protein